MSAALTIPEWASVLDPPMSERQLYLLVEALEVPRAGVRHLGRSGRPRNTYAAEVIMRVHSAVVGLRDVIAPRAVCAGPAHREA